VAAGKTCELRAVTGCSTVSPQIEFPCIDHRGKSLYSGLCAGQHADGAGAQMNNTTPSNRGGTGLLGLLLAGGLIIGGWVMGVQIKATRLSDRYVTVRGLVERKVKSNLAVWPINYKEAGDDLSLVYAKTEADKKEILRFLDQQGIQSSEIELGTIRVVDTQANEYGGSNRAPRRYIVEQRITVRTSRVDQIAAAAQKTMQLLQKGIVLNSNPGQGLTYKFTGLNSIKPDMITEATRNARAAAERFAFDSGSKVGSIRQANQGVFSILPADQSSDTSEPSESGGNFSPESSLMKTVRVVTSVQYYLDK
jgi:hypothetical protein